MKDCGCHIVGREHVYLLAFICLLHILRRLNKNTYRSTTGDKKVMDINGERKRPVVVIVGAGFAGMNAAKALRKAPVDVVLVDRNNYHKFQPLLYQVATAGLEPDEIAHNVRQIFRNTENVSFRLGTVERIDTAQKQLLLRSGASIAYDYLILAAGAVTHYFGVEGVQEYGFPLKNLPDAIDMRNHILRQFERCDRHPEEIEEGALNFVIVGGGPTGVEMAGALVELFEVMRKDFRHVDTRKAQVYLIEMASELLPPYQPSLRTYTKQVLEKRGVHVLTETTVSKVTAKAVHLKNGEAISTQTLIWAAGIQGNPIGGTLHADLASGRRVKVEADLRVLGYTDIFITGDMAGSADATGELYPQVAQVAMQQGRHAARQILRLLEEKPTEPFVYKDLGQMATIGRHAAVVELGSGMKAKGFFAWMMWVFIHILKLIGFRNRLNVLVNWAYDYFTYDRSARLILNMVPISDELPHEVEYVNAQLAD